VVIPDPEAIAEKIDWLYDHKNKAVDVGKVESEKYCQMDISYDNVLTKLMEE
jgi:hypothetical protein